MGLIEPSETVAADEDHPGLGEPEGRSRGVPDGGAR